MSLPLKHPTATRAGGRYPWGPFPTQEAFYKTLYLLPPLIFCLPIQTPIIFPDNAIRTSGVDIISSPPSEPTQHLTSPVAPVSPMHTSLQPPPGDQQSFVTLTPPLALSVGGEEYLVSLTEDEGITDLFSSFDLDRLPLDMPHLSTAAFGDSIIS